MTTKPPNRPKYGGSIVIADWMIRSLQLQGEELIIYAIIHSFSQDGDSVFYGSISYLSFWTGLGKTTVITKLKKLLEKKLIEKKNVPVARGSAKHYCQYWTVLSRLPTEIQKKIMIK